MKQVQVKRLATNRIKKGYPILVENDFSNPDIIIEGEIVELVDPKNNFLAIAYIGFENRTNGYILSLEKTEINQRFFEDKFRKARDLRASFYEQDETNAFRVFNGEGDGVGGLIIDNYNGFYIFSWFSKGILQMKEDIVAAFINVFIDFKGAYEKFHYRNAKVQSKHLLGDQASAPYIVKENGIKFATYLDEGLMTGIFLDQRNVRRQVMNEYGIGKTVLNLFSYTGAFSVVAAMGGAIKTVSVDVANRSKPKTMEQFEVNGLDPMSHEIRVIDTDSYLDYAVKHELKFGLIVVDPPTFARFSNNKTFSVEEDYPEMISKLLDVLDDDGTIILSTNAWKLSRDDFFLLVKEGFDSAGEDGFLIEEFALPEDFNINKNYPESSYLKVFALSKN